MENILELNRKAVSDGIIIESDSGSDCDIQEDFLNDEFPSINHENDEVDDDVADFADEIGDFTKKYNAFRVHMPGPNSQHKGGAGPNFAETAADSTAEKKRKRVKDRADRATVEQVLDPRTRLVLFRLLQRGALTNIHGCISTGKEANVYHATDDKGSLAVKIYKTSILTFKDRERYVAGEYRYRTGYCKHNPRKMVAVWAEKEMRNLLRMHQAGLPVPKPILLKGHVLVMEFIGRDGWGAPLLKNATLSHEVAEKLYLQLVRDMRTLYRACKLVHADLSEYNTLVLDDRLFIIDVSQSVEHDHPHALDFLRSDSSATPADKKKKQQPKPKPRGPPVSSSGSKRQASTTKLSKSVSELARKESLHSNDTHSSIGARTTESPLLDNSSVSDEVPQEMPDVESHKEVDVLQVEPQVFNETFFFNQTVTSLHVDVVQQNGDGPQNSELEEVVMEQAISHDNMHTSDDHQPEQASEEESMHKAVHEENEADGSPAVAELVSYNKSLGMRESPEVVHVPDSAPADKDAKEAAAEASEKDDVKSDNFEDKVSEEASTAGEFQESKSLLAEEKGEEPAKMEERSVVSPPKDVVDTPPNAAADSTVNEAQTNGIQKQPPPVIAELPGTVPATKETDDSIVKKIPSPPNEFIAHRLRREQEQRELDERKARIAAILAKSRNLSNAATPLVAGRTSPPR
ncbi:RIO1 family protein, partial [Teladorsagia circumcincta]